MECAGGVVKLPVPVPRQGNATHSKHVPRSPSPSGPASGAGRSLLRDLERAGRAMQRGPEAGSSVHIAGWNPSCRLDRFTFAVCRHFLQTCRAFATKSVAWQSFSGSLSILQCIICLSHTFWSPVEGGTPSADLLLILRPRARL